MSRKTPIVTLAVVAVLALSTATALAVPTVGYEEIPLTQEELDTNWVVDRAVPSGGFES
jgi:hypothetical protein